MPRPSLKDARRKEILDAYGRCIARHGVAGTTLELIAEEAGLARALIRHNVGNKEEILDAFVERYLTVATAEVDELFDSLPGKKRIETMIEWLFDPTYSDAQAVNVSNALFMAAVERPFLAEPLRRWTADFTQRMEAELSDVFGASGERVAAVAAGIVAIYYNYESLALLGDLQQLRKTSEAAARALVSTLA